MQDGHLSSPDEEAAVLIEAPVSAWFFKRCLLLGLLLGGMGLYFCYDGFIGYPKQNRNADIYDAFLAGKEGQPFASVSESEKVDAPLYAAHEAAGEGKSWAAHAASLHLPAEPPKRHTDADIATQKRIAVALGLGAILVAIWSIVHRGRAWSMNGERIRTPWNTQFSAGSITDIDRRRWDRGIALLISNDKDRFLKLKLDDYKYREAGRIIDAVAALNSEVRIDPPLAKTDDVGSDAPGGGGGESQ